MMKGLAKNSFVIISLLSQNALVLEQDARASHFLPGTQGDDLDEVARRRGERARPTSSTDDGSDAVDDASSGTLVVGRHCFLRCEVGSLARPRGERLF